MQEFLAVFCLHPVGLFFCFLFFFSAVDWTQDFGHARQAFYHWAPSLSFLRQGLTI
jgi:hypothetical protein